MKYTKYAKELSGGFVDTNYKRVVLSADRLSNFTGTKHCELYYISVFILLLVVATELCILGVAVFGCVCYINCEG